MKRAFYDKDRAYDAMFDSVIETARISCEENDDDYGLLCVGATGTGKSSLMMWAYEKFDADGCNVDFIGLDRVSFANALKQASEKPSLRFAANDEANVSKRDALTTFNKDLLDLYYSIRGLNIFWWWNNPSADMIDKPFLKERLKGLIFIFTKNVDGHPRLYYYYHMTDLLKLWEKYGDLSLKTLKKGAEKYAYYRGWFREYKGALWVPYLEKKQRRMLYKVDDFFNKYGMEDNKKKINPKQMREILMISEGYYYTNRKYWMDNNIIKEGVDYVLDNFGHLIFYESAIGILQSYIRSEIIDEKGNVVPLLLYKRRVSANKANAIRLERKKKKQELIKQ